ncbi:MAG TPA: AAA family ATPase [Candidatus Dormibacteraeota bacterium]|nr:AAA family ATPase [Candidatus Dormibacteraeota bacterium]
MRITRLRLRDFQRHEDLDLEFAPGLTVVRGPNEAGKTTVQRAIEMALFRRVTSAGADVEATRRWGADGGSPSVGMDFEHEGIDGHLEKTFAGAKGQAQLRYGGEEVTDPAEVDRRLAELTGLPSEKFYRSTASVHHYELDDLDRDETALRDRLQASMSGADRGTTAARKKLEDAQRRFTTEGPKNPGILKQDRDQVAALEAQVTQGEAGLASLERDRSNLSVARDAHDGAEDRLAAARDGLDRSEQAVHLLERQLDAQGRYARYKRASELRDEMIQKEATHPSRIALPVLRATVDRLRNQEATIGRLRQELSDQPDLSSYDVGQLPTPAWRRWAMTGLGLVVLGILIALIGVTTSLGDTGALIGAVLAVVGVGVNLWALRLQRRSSDVKRQNELREAEIARRLRGRTDIEQQLKDTEAARDAGLASIEQPDTDTAQRLLEAEAAHVAGIEALQAEYRGVLGDEQPSDDVSRLRDRAAAEAEQAKHALSGMGDIGADPHASRDRYRAALGTAQAERERTLQALAQAQAAVDQNGTDADEVAAASEGLAAARERLAWDERRHRIIGTALGALDAAEQATMKKAARFLEGRMAADVARITGGRYQRVQVDESELGMRVWSPERGDWVDVAGLSQGTIDSFYLAARLGLVRQVTQDRRPPLIFDDPFLTFDRARAQQALELLREMAADHQVIYLTTADRYDAVADRVIELPGPTAVDAGEAAPA